MTTPRWFFLPLAAALLLGPAVCSSPAQPAAQPTPSSAQPDAAPPTPPALYLGTAWYPEQWPPDKYPGRWDADLSLMEAAHIRFVRVAEFAWSTLEPSEGHYDLDWLDHAIRAAARHHIAVVIGTPAPLHPPGSPPNIPRPSASRKTAAPTSTATASSSTGPTQSIASSPAPWPSS